MTDRPMLGGNASSEIRMHICGAHGKNNRETGILEELLLKNHYRNAGCNWAVWDSVVYETDKRTMGLKTSLAWSTSNELGSSTGGNKLPGKVSDHLVRMSPSGKGWIWLSGAKCGRRFCPWWSNRLSGRQGQCELESFFRVRSGKVGIFVFSPTR